MLAAAVLTVAAAGVVHAVTAEPPARRVRCGEVLTADVRLAADLRCDGPGGLVVAADGVDVDLDGHAVTGPGLVTGRSSAAHGISVRARGATVRDGRVDGWDVGIDVVARGATAAVRDVRLEADGVGAAVGEGSSLYVTTSLLRGSNTGATAQGTLVVDRSRVEENFTGVAVQTGEPGGPVTLRRTLLRHNHIGLLCHRPGFLVERSAFAANDTALVTSDCAPWTVRESAFTGNALHLWLDESRPFTFACTSFTPRDVPQEVRVQPCAARTGAVLRAGTAGG
ncbi:hypothetical protein [Kineococcus sp. G2]|uniref:hypothetical protein n=1 Tax=Kineococcus sp. G2 TaxID=3127484 RepID=UPI00301D6D41